MNLIDAAIVALRAERSASDEACCVYAQHVDEVAFGLPPATGQTLADERLYDIAKPWSPATVAMDRGIAEWVRCPPSVATPERGRWHKIQGWRGTPGGPGITGHTFHWKQVDDQYGLQLDDAVGRKPDLRFRSWQEIVQEFHGGLAVALLKLAPAA